MKKVLIIAFALVLLFAVAHRANTYEIQGKVIANDIVQDETGYIWEYDTNGFHVGDKVIITFQEKGNENRRTDDIVKEIKKDV